MQDCSHLSVKCTPRTLVSVSSSPLPLSAKLCSMSVNRSVQEIEFYRIISRLLHISYTNDILGKAITSVCQTLVHEYPSIRSRVGILLHKQQPISYTRDILGRAIVDCPSNAHPQLQCLSAPLHYLCLLNYGVSIRSSVRILPHNQQAHAHLIPQRHNWEGRRSCPSNAHPQHWCLSAPLHHLCLSNLVP